MSDLECPYCEEGLDVNHDDGFGYEENKYHEMECEHCGKKFVFETMISFSYEASRADCLNDGNHNWNPTRTFPLEFTMMKCTMCHEERKPTTEELKFIMNAKK